MTKTPKQIADELAKKLAADLSGMTNESSMASMILQDLTLESLIADGQMLDHLESIKQRFHATSECDDWTIILPCFRPPKFGYVNNVTLRTAISDAMNKDAEALGKE